MKWSAKNSNPKQKPQEFFSWEPSLLNAFPSLPHNFYLKPAPSVARSLLGKGLYIAHEKQTFLCQIVEVEAYLGNNDPASHAFKGPTQRNQSMFEVGGTCYVYLSYGINFCMNVVTGAKGKGSAVLIRAAIPLLGLQEMAKNRRISMPLNQKSLKNLLNGPGKLTQALGIDRTFDGVRFDQTTFKIVDLQYTVPKHQIGLSPRIGISKAKDEKLRFFIRNCEFLSRPE